MARVLFASRIDKRCKIAARYLKHRYEITVEVTAQNAVSTLAGGGIDVLVTDLSFLEKDNIRLLRSARKLDETLSIVFVWVSRDLRAIRCACAAGISVEYVSMSFNRPRTMSQLERAVATASKKSGIRRRARAIEDGNGCSQNARGIAVCASSAMQEIVARAKRLHDYDGPVLIQGPTGAGKEVVALTIHTNSRFGKGSFVPVNVSTLTRELVASELFGHARGAFTGAMASRKGAFEEANRGTLVLDEIGELPMDLQAVLLRAVEEKIISPVGSTKRVPLDLRVIASTNRSLEGLVERGKFRKDLYYRLNAQTINVPPLKERPEDIDALAHHFLQHWAYRMQLRPLCMDPRAAQLLRAYPWEGNVRELQSKMHQIVSLCDGDVVTTKIVARVLTSTRVAETIDGDLSVSFDKKLDQVARQYLREALRACNHKQRRAAEICGLKYNKFRYQAQRLGVLDEAGKDVATPSEEVADMAADESPQPVSAVETVLIVDDNQAILNALCRLLKDDCAIRTANSGGEALQVMAEEDNFVLILCDVLMPDMTGVEVHRRIRRWRPDLAERFVFMSGHFDEPDVDAFVGRVGLPTIAKPLNANKVKDLLETIK